jgi:hypothetical protein
MHRQLTFRRLAASVLLLCYLLACGTWQTQEVSPQELITETEPRHMRATLADGSQREYWEPWIHADSLRGYEHDRWRAPNPYRLVEVEPASLTDIADVAVRKTDVPKTVAFTALTIVVVGVAAFYIGWTMADYDLSYGGN